MGELHIASAFDRDLESIQALVMRMGGMVEQAILGAAGADAYVTADVKYHEFFGPEGRFMLCDVGHFESEQFTGEVFQDLLMVRFGRTFAVLLAQTPTNPDYYDR